LRVLTLADGGKFGFVGDEEVLLVRRGTEVSAVGTLCTHYHGPLVDGIAFDNTVRCPWHHACFNLRTGEALRAPALSPIACWSVELTSDRILVREKQLLPTARPRRSGAAKPPDRIVIVGGGAAGIAAAERLRREEYTGNIVMPSSDDAVPIDQPHAIDLRLKTRNVKVHLQTFQTSVLLQGPRTFRYPPWHTLRPDLESGLH
jgi:nitrite reductase/ring-hydroxylating ferredoxin subunit